MRNRGFLRAGLLLAGCAVLLLGCSAKKQEETQTENLQAEGIQTEVAKMGRLRVVSTIFPAYDWAREVIGDQAEAYELTCLLEDGADLHSYQPTAEDLLKISEADVFLYVGGESDRWVEKVLSSAPAKDRQVINLMEVLGERVQEERLVEGMEEEHSDHTEESAPEETEYDEHVWLSLQNAMTVIEKLEESFAVLDPEHQKAYEDNGAHYRMELSELDEEYRQVVNASTKKTLLFGDRFPFRYLAEDYGINYYAAFPGCSAETEASFQTVVFLSGKLEELKLPVVLTIDHSDGKLAETIIRNTEEKNQAILSLNSLQSVTRKEQAEGMTYLKAMEENLQVLKKALN